MVFWKKLDTYGIRSEYEVFQLPACDSRRCQHSLKLSSIEKNGGCSSVVERYIVIVDAESSILSNRPLRQI